ncbi:MAG: type II toxin-antitoxin system VapC family toxin [Bacteroidaceae bacterium]|nr:type II toxin-antitoxin system VapC family toxin [Bacteroidaceae bacterium]
MRTLIDTCVVIDWMMNDEALEDGVWEIIDDPENRIYISAETVRELVVNFNNKKLLNKRWKTAKDMLCTIEDEYGLEVLPVTRNVVATYTSLQLNEAMEHYDPSDHIIISHAITERMTLISSDTKFPFYRNQGLELIEY